MKGKLIYKESQSFSYTWSWYLAIIIAFVMVSMFGRGLYIQFVLGESWGNQPMNNSELAIVSILTITVIVGIVIFLSIHHLEVQVDDGSMRYRFRPYFNSFKTLSKDKVNEIYVRKYNPVWEYGGWGYRRRFKKGKAFNITGNWGLQIVFNDGKKLLLGTQKPKELEKAIAQLKVNWEME